MGKVIRELCKKCDHTTKWLVHKPESVLENETKKNSLGIWDTKRSLYPSQTTQTSNSQQKRVSKLKLATVIEGDPKARFSIATTPRYTGLLHFSLDPYLIMVSVKHGGIKYHFLSLWYDTTWDWTQVSVASGEHSNHYANVRKKICQIMDFAVPEDHQLKIKESEKIDKCLDLARELKKAMEHDSDGDTICGWYSWNNPQVVVKGSWKTW